MSNLKYLNFEENLILNGKCDFNKNIQQLWEWGGGIKDNMQYNVSISFKDGSKKTFTSTESRAEAIKQADDYLQEIE